MSHKALVEKIRDYNPFNDKEGKKCKDLLKFTAENDNIFTRTNIPGHITGSAWVLSTAKTKVLMTHHVKLGKWLQLGGHADGSSDILEVARREAEEESGLNSIEPLSKQIFDVDVHAIPSREKFPRHFHYDMRFLFQADEKEPIKISNESYSIKWIPLQEVYKYNPEESIIRLTKKSLPRNLTRFMKKGFW